MEDVRSLSINERSNAYSLLDILLCRNVANYLKQTNIYNNVTASTTLPNSEQGTNGGKKIGLKTQKRKTGSSRGETTTNSHFDSKNINGTGLGSVENVGKEGEI